MIADHWRRAGRLKWSEADLDSAIERLLDITNADLRVIRQILQTGIVSSADVDLLGKASASTVEMASPTPDAGR